MIGSRVVAVEGLWSEKILNIFWRQSQEGFLLGYGVLMKRSRVSPRALAWIIGRMKELVHRLLVIIEFVPDVSSSKHWFIKLLLYYILIQLWGCYKSKEIYRVSRHPSHLCEAITSCSHRWHNSLERELVVFCLGFFLLLFIVRNIFYIVTRYKANVVVCVFVNGWMER